MKKNVFMMMLLCFGCFLALSPQPVEAAKSTEMYVSAKSDIILRAKPAQNAAKLGTIKNHTKLNVLSASKGWSYVQAGKSKGYVYSSALSKKNPVVAPTTVTKGLTPVDGLILTYTPSFWDDERETFHVKKNGRLTELYNKSSPLYPDSSYLYSEGRNELMMGVNNSDVIFVDVAYPLKQGTYTTGRVLVESTTKTIKVKAGSFRNVVILRHPNGAREYLAKGIGIIKSVNGSGQTITELASYSTGK
ncbi:SH3 domain-containing protein [Sporosarcina cascadiensis]|uniref:SH3 domain-containing protein n=1 Tax=Sporosarcina cascadiensis TaxID=2660747 RepID=UPI00129B01A9|nr:SH3 domain-containing protein [Sporosarcina cascadiensis]